MANPFRLGSVVAAAVVAALCGSGDAFVGSAARVASWRTANAATSALDPVCRGSRCSSRPSGTMALRPPLNGRPLSRGGWANGTGQRGSSSWPGLRGADDDVVARRGGHGATAKGETASGDGSSAGVQEGRGSEGARLRGFAGPAAVLRFARKAVERGASKAGAGTRARIASWRRRVSVALIGVAAALVIMTSSAGPAQALFGIPAREQAPPMRLTSMPESVYVQREQLAEFCQTPPGDRLFDFKDLTVYDEELDKLDMFADNIAPAAGSRESFRLKYQRHAEDYLQGESGTRKNGAYGVARFAFVGTVGLLAIGTVLGSFLWTCKAFLNMAREEEVFLYGEEISVDATEKEEELDDIDEDLDFDDDDMEDYSVGDSAGGPDPSPPSMPPPDNEGGISDGDDDLLGL